jgi:uncharacterized membrane protein YkoI
MKLHPIMLILGVITLAAGCATEQPEGKESDETVSLSQVPPAVKETIKAYASESEIKKIEKGDVDGKTAYEFVIQKNGKDSEVTIYPNGNLLGTEEAVMLSEVPEAARNAINTHAAGGRLVSTEKVVEDAKTVYEAVVEKDGKKTEYSVAPDGRLVGTEKVKEGKE